MRIPNSFIISATIRATLGRAAPMAMAMPRARRQHLRGLPPQQPGRSARPTASSQPARHRSSSLWRTPRSSSRLPRGGVRPASGRPQWQRRRRSQRSSCRARPRAGAAALQLSPAAPLSNSRPMAAVSSCSGPHSIGSHEATNVLCNCPSSVAAESRHCFGSCYYRGRLAWASANAAAHALCARDSLTAAAGACHRPPAIRASR